MRYYAYGSNRSKKRVAIVNVLIACPLILSLLVSCNPYKPNVQNNETTITFVTSIGLPPVDSITWSPADKNAISVTAGDVGKGRAEVYLLNIKSGQKQTIARTEYGDFVSSSWAPDNKYILFSVRDHSMGYEPGGIWIYDTENKSSKYFFDSGYAVWAPDNKTIATFSVEDINTDSERIDLNLINPITKTKETIYTTNKAKYFWGLSWSPNGNNLVFAIGQDIPGNLYIINIHTKQTLQLTDKKMASDPVWSPAGNIIAYVSWPTEGIMTTLHLLDSNGKCDITIPILENVLSPTWSPDGKQLGYIGDDGIYVMDVYKEFGRDIYQNLCP